MLVRCPETKYHLGVQCCADDLMCYAAARLAGEDVKVKMLGQVGDDGFGKDYFEALGKEGIDAEGVGLTKSSKRSSMKS